MIPKSERQRDVFRTRGSKRVRSFGVGKGPGGRAGVHWAALWLQRVCLAWVLLLASGQRAVPALAMLAEHPTVGSRIEAPHEASKPEAQLRTVDSYSERDTEPADVGSAEDDGPDFAHFSHAQRAIAVAALQVAGAPHLTVLLQRRVASACPRGPPAA